MKIEIEASDELVISIMEDMINTCMSANIPSKLPVPEHQREDFEAALKYCQAMNTIIEYCGGRPVELHKVPEHKKERTIAEEYEEHLRNWKCDYEHHPIRGTQDLDDSEAYCPILDETPASWRNTFYPYGYPGEVKGQAVPQMPGTYYRNE